jgi:hypothetical protein
MASHDLIEEYLATVRRRLPADAVDELADGLAQTYQAHLSRSRDPVVAATAAITEFGDPDLVSRAFTHAAPGRRTALALLATGPAAALCWATAVRLDPSWVRAVPVTARVTFGLALAVVVALLLYAATSRVDYARTRVAAAGAAGLIILDLVVPATGLLISPGVTWPLGVAVAASAARITFALSALPAIARR